MEDEKEMKEKFRWAIPRDGSRSTTAAKKQIKELFFLPFSIFLPLANFRVFISGLPI